MKSAEEKYPLPFTAEPVATQNCTCYTCQIARREGYTAGMQEKEKDAVEFAEWIDSNEYKKYENGFYRNTPPIAGKQVWFTLAELFNLFNQDK